MDREKVIRAFATLGRRLQKPDCEPQFKAAIQQACEENKWFSPSDVTYALSAVAEWLNDLTLRSFCDKYNFASTPQTVAVVMAGNIPAVGFADMLYVLLAGHRFLGKLSHQDGVLLPFLAEWLIAEEPLMATRIEFSKDKISNYDAVIATGSDNSAKYFDYYFASLPHIVRRSRYSLAVLSQNVDTEALNRLADDVFLYNGLGCRSVGKIYLPFGFTMQRLVDSFARYAVSKDCNKYRNNYDYHRVTSLMNNESFIDGGFFLLRENKSLYSPVAVVNYEFYTQIDDVFAAIDQNRTSIQCVVSDLQRNDTIPCGFAQRPHIDDFADGVDVMKFLLSLSPQKR
ncbi:MAG: hypothetical protein LBR17_09615 [Bacteroidales bacterium]|jgi:hypothetical protein|nr:hypothetical protein [Bacteroidales bacterium]